MARAPVALAALLVLAACGGDRTAATTTTTADCPAAPRTTVIVSGAWQAVLPPGSVATRVEGDVPATVHGQVPLEPSAIYDHYEDSAALELLGGEDEGHESEVLATDGQHRVSLKVVRICPGRSSLRAVVAPEQGATSTTDP